MSRAIASVTRVKVTRASASEPLPNDLLNLIDHDAANADDGKGGPGSNTPGGKKA